MRAIVDGVANTFKRSVECTLLYIHIVFLQRCTVVAVSLTIL